MKLRRLVSDRRGARRAFVFGTVDRLVRTREALVHPAVGNDAGRRGTVAGQEC